MITDDLIGFLYLPGGICGSLFLQTACFLSDPALPPLPLFLSQLQALTLWLPRRCDQKEALVKNRGARIVKRSQVFSPVFLLLLVSLTMAVPPTWF